MGQQKGVIQITGAVGNLSFYKTKDGYLVRGKGGVDGKRIKSDPRFVRTRENGAEFGRAGKASKVLRKALRALLLNVADSGMTNRMTTEMVKVIQADEVNVRGLRNVIDGEAELLTGFEFNENARLEGAFVAPYTTAIDRVTGSTSVNIPLFDPSRFVVAPQGATHCRLVAGSAVIDFENETFVAKTSQSADIDLKAVNQAALNLVNAITPNSGSPIFVAFGIEFLQFVNGKQYPLSNGAFNALSLVLVDGGVRAAGARLKALAALETTPSTETTDSKAPTLVVERTAELLTEETH